jgi:hypothetical protein
MISKSKCSSCVGIQVRPHHNLLSFGSGDELPSVTFLSATGTETNRGHFDTGSYKIYCGQGHCCVAPYPSRREACATSSMQRFRGRGRRGGTMGKGGHTRISARPSIEIIPLFWQNGSGTRCLCHSFWNAVSNMSEAPSDTVPCETPGVCGCHLISMAGLNSAL